MIDEQSSASGHDYASDHSAIGAVIDAGETMTNTLTYQYCHVCDVCIPRPNVHGRYYGVVVIMLRPPPPSRRRAAASADTSLFNITDTQTYLYCHVAIIIDIIDNITDIIALSGWQYLLMPMSLLPMRQYIYITVSVVLLTPMTISLIFRQRLTYIAVSVVLLTSVTLPLTCRYRLTYSTVSVVLLVIYHRRADICRTYIFMSVILLILVTISVAILQYIYITVSAVIINY